MKSKLMILGAGGQGRVCADIASLVGYEQIFFLDDGATKSATVVGTVADAAPYVDEYDFFVAVGNPAVRRKLILMLRKTGASIATLIHPAATVAKAVCVGEGTAVMAGAVVNVGTRIGEGVIVNTCASVDHDCTVGNYVHVSVGAHLCGTVSVGENTWIGAGATVINNIDICAGCMIGAGAVVVKSINECGTYLGVPARKKSE